MEYIGRQVKFPKKKKKKFHRKNVGPDAGQRRTARREKSNILRWIFFFSFFVLHHLRTKSGENSTEISSKKPGLASNFRKIRIYSNSGKFKFEFTVKIPPGKHEKTPSLLSSHLSGFRQGQDAPFAGAGRRPRSARVSRLVRRVRGVRVRPRRALLLVDHVLREGDVAVPPWFQGDGVLPEVVQHVEDRREPEMLHAALPLVV